MSNRGAVVITGGSTGIGRACAIALAQANFDVLIAGRRRNLLEEARREVEAVARNASVFTRTTDVGDPAECEALITDAVEQFGSIYGLINAAAICEPRAAVDLDAESWDRTLDVNLRGSALCSVAAARHMVTRGGGRIVLFSSINGAISEPESAHYSASKAAVASLARSLAVDLAEQRITVNAVAPGWVLTPMTSGFLEGATPEALRRLNPLARLADPSEIANVVTYLIAEAPMFLTGATLFVDGGQTAAAPLP